MHRRSMLLALTLCVAAWSSALSLGQPAAFAADAVPLDATTRNYDQLHLDLDVDLDLETGRITGTAIHRLRALDDLQTIRMHLMDMEVREVRCDDVVLAPAVHADGVISVELDRPRKSGEELRLTFRYDGVPQAGLWFFRPSEQYPGIPYQVWSQGQGTENRHWFPCYDLPDDRLESRLRVTVPANLTTLSNGVPVRREELESGRVAHTWALERPHPSYLITLVVGDFEEVVSDADGVEHHDLVPPGWKDWVPESFGRVPDMMRFLKSYTGQDYAWPRHSQVTVWDFMWGGMENTGATTLNMRALHKEGVRPDYSADGLVAHELAHQWFGDLVTCRTWNHIWLNEGFATYFTDLWLEQYEDEDAFRVARMHSKQSYMDGSDLTALSIAAGPPSRTDCGDMQANPYTKGSSALHMLRHLLGPEEFRLGVRRYIAENKDQSVESEALRRALETQTGQPLGWFFDQWIYGSGFPQLDVRSAWKGRPRKGELGTLTLDVRQTQPITELMPAFRSPVDVVIVWSADNIERRRLELHRQSHSFVFQGPQAPELVLFDPEDWLLARVAEDKRRPAWVAQLVQAPYVVARIRAARALGSTGVKSVPALANAARAPSAGGDARHEVRAAACTALGEIAGIDAAQALVAASDDPDSRVRRAALEALGSCPSHWCADALARHALDDPSVYAAAQAALALGKTRAPGAFDVLEQVLARESHRDEIRRCVMDGLAALGDPRGASLALPYTDYAWGKGTQHRLRHAALDALVALAPHAPATHARVVELLEDPYFRMQQWAAAHAAALGIEEAVPVLERVIESARGPGVRPAAERALAHLRPAPVNEPEDESGDTSGEDDR